MGEAAGAGAAGLSLAGLGFQIASGVMKTKGAMEAADYKAEQLDRAAQVGRLKATQVSGQLTEHLVTTLGNIDAIRAAGHNDPTSPTGVAVREHAEYLGDRQRSTAVGNILSQAREDEAGAAYMRYASTQALLSGIFSIGADVGKAGAGSPLFTMGSGGGGAVDPMSG